MLGQLDNHIQQYESWTLYPLYTMHKINFRWIININVNNKIKLSEENIGKYLYNFRSKQRLFKQDVKKSHKGKVGFH